MESPFLLFFGAVMASAWYGGLRSGLLATGLSALVADYFFLTPVGSFLGHDWGQNLRLVLFVLEGAFISYLAERLHSAMRLKERGEASLREWKSRYDAAVQATGHVLYDWNAVTNSVTYGGQHEAVLGYTAQDLGSDLARWIELIHPDDRGSFEKERERVVATRKPFRLDYRVRRKDGSYAVVQDDGRFFFDAGGKPVRMVGFVADVTERTRAREALAESEARFRIMADTAPVMVWMAGPARLRDWFNEPWLRFTGRAMEQEVGDGWAEGLHPEDYDRCLAGVADASDQRQPFEMEYRLRRADGEYRWILDRGTPRFGPEGGFAGYVGSCIDMTERRQEETRHRFLAEASAILGSSLDYETTLTAVARLAVPALADWCIVDLLMGDGKARRVAVAHADPGKAALAAEVRRFPPGEKRENPPVMGLRSEAPVLIPEFTEEMMEAAAPDPEHLATMRAVGPRSFLVAPLVARGRKLGAITWMFTAESGRRYTPADLPAAEELGRRAAQAVENARLYRELQDANRLKDEFLATLSHELRTPLNAIVGWAHVLMDGRLDRATARKGLETIKRNARLQNQLISDILDVSRIIAGKLRLEVRPVDPASAIEAALDTVRPAAEAKGIRLEPALHPSAGPVSGDADRLQQVVWNLLSNAIKFSPAREGRVQVRLEPVDFHVEIVVEDNGPGIDPAFLPYVFERFRQADSSSTRVHRGLGLGLAIVRHLVELHGGTVEARNREGPPGAIFTVKLPRLSPVSAETGEGGQRRHPADEESVWLNSAPSLEGLRVLVVDDEPDARELIATILIRCGAQVVTAASAGDGLAALQRERPQVLLADIEMPGEDGYELLRKVRALPADRGGSTPAAALTAYAGDGNRMKALQAGFQFHIAKPVQPAELAGVVASLAGRGGFSGGRPSSPSAMD